MNLQKRFDMYIEHKIKAQKSWTGGQTFTVYKYKCENLKVLSEEKVFSGSLLECDAFIRLVESNLLSYE